MKRSGRTLKQRLYGIKHLPSHISRARYFRGHGVHSPYIYNIVRQVFMAKKLRGEEHELYDTLVACGIAQRRALQLQNLATHCEYRCCVVDSQAEADLTILTTQTPNSEFEEYYNKTRERGATLCIMSPYLNAERWERCRKLIEAHSSTTVDNRAYLLIFNNHLPRQRFKL